MESDGDAHGDARNGAWARGTIDAVALECQLGLLPDGPSCERGPGGRTCKRRGTRPSIADVNARYHATSLGIGMACAMVGPARRVLRRLVELYSCPSGFCLSVLSDGGPPETWRGRWDGAAAVGNGG